MTDTTKQVSATEPEVESTPDFRCYPPKSLDYEKLDPGIKNTVKWLINMGFHTTDSGDGCYKAAFDYEEMIDIPHVFMVVDKYSLVKQADRLHNLLITYHGIFVEHIGTANAYIEATFDPSDDSAVIGLFNVHDGMLKDA